jgi:hypothetical protein
MYHGGATLSTVTEEDAMKDAATQPERTEDTLAYRLGMATELIKMLLEDGPRTYVLKRAPEFLAEEEARSRRVMEGA